MPFSNLHVPAHHIKVQFFITQEKTARMLKSETSPEFIDQIESSDQVSGISGKHFQRIRVCGNSGWI